MSQHSDTSLPSHGERAFSHLAVSSYSLEVEDSQGMVGDQASETAFRKILRSWQETVERAGAQPFGLENADDLPAGELDRIAASSASADNEASRTLALAVIEFSGRLAHVIQRFMQDAGWHGVERITVGGGFKESLVGRVAIRHAEERLREAGVAIPLRPLHAAADEGGLLGWASIVDRASIGPAFLAVDIGGTNVRCGIVESLAESGAGREGEAQAAARVLEKEKWRHADDGPAQKDLVEGIVDMLHRLIEHAQAQGIRLSPFIGIACPGTIREDGSIERGAHNLPGDWSRASFHLPRRLVENLPQLGGGDTRVVMHNDAVIQGLSELPYMREVRRWAALTIGTGLGNASFDNRAG